MSYTYEEVMALLGDEAQAVPGAIVVFRNKHIEVAKLDVGGAFIVTDAGRSLLDELKAPAEPVKPAKRTKKTEQVVESANELVDDLSLGD